LSEIFRLGFVYDKVDDILREVASQNEASVIITGWIDKVDTRTASTG